MGGTPEGGRKSYETQLIRYGIAQIKKRNAKGGKVKVKKGFAKLSKEAHRKISSEGGKKRWQNGKM